MLTTVDGHWELQAAAFRLADGLTCFCFFLCTVTDFSAAERATGVKFCMLVGLLSGQVFSPFGEDWLAGSHGGGGICRRPGVDRRMLLVVIHDTSLS